MKGARLLIAMASALLLAGCQDSFFDSSNTGATPGSGTVACADKGQNCRTSGDCCGALTCPNGTCTDGGCLPRWSHCKSSGDCCSVLTCAGGICN
ncbi:MAG: hypothetical protein HY549_12125 [Elusimicrobia bacterium]|nr:hypothetical protein [Elusimicrobiota bacterium]